MPGIRKGNLRGIVSTFLHQINAGDIGFCRPLLERTNRSHLVLIDFLQIDHLQIHHLQIDHIQIGHQQICHPDPNLSLQHITWEKGSEYRAETTQEACPTGHADYTAPKQRHELDHADRTDQESVYISALKYLENDLWEYIFCR